MDGIVRACVRACVRGWMDEGYGRRDEIVCCVGAFGVWKEREGRGWGC